MRPVVSAGLGFSAGYKPFKVIGIAHNGQSLSTGNLSDPTLTPSQPFSNLQLHDSSGNYTSPASGTWSTIPLITPVRADKYGGGGMPTTPYPVNIGGETAEVAMANVMALLSGAAGYQILTHNCGEGGAAYSVIGPGGTGNAFQSMLNEITVAVGLDIGYGVSFALLTHGEADAQDPPGQYEADLVAYQAAFQSDAGAIAPIPPNGIVPLILSQQNAYPTATGVPVNEYNQSGIDQLAAAVNNPGLIVAACPKYYLPYVQTGAGALGHLTNVGEQMLGEKYGEVAYYLASGQPWRPFIPMSATLVGNVVTVEFQVPIGPLQFSSAFTAPHLSGTYAAWAAGLGFEAWSGGYGGTIVEILSVSIVGGNKVEIACNTPPDTIGYAQTPDATSGLCGGFPSGRCGLLTDSDPFVGPYSGNAQPNWCLAFVMSA